MAKRASRARTLRREVEEMPALIPAVQSSPWLRLGGTALVVFGSLAFLAPVFAAKAAITLWLGHSAPFVGGALAVVGVVLLLIALQRDGVDAPSEKWPKLEVADILWPPRFFKNFLWGTWILLDKEAATEREARAKAGKGYDFRPLVVLASGAVFLALMEYFGHDNTLQDLINAFDPRTVNLYNGQAVGPATNFWGELRDSEYRRLLGLGWWAVWRVLGFFMLPAIVLKLMGEKISDYGLRTRGFREHAWIYGVLYAIVLVAVIVVSFEQSFQTYYPFYRGPEPGGSSGRSWYDFWAWELLYFAQFFSLEFFFRGFWLRGAARAMGSHAIYAMVVPYCMIHFGKPFPETIAAIAAGIALGTLALRTRSIWSGFLIHISVAVTMDVAALLQTTGLPHDWWPPGP